MKVEIWSDVVCPFCYIGKRNFEKALAAFSAREKVEVVWRSYQLDPDLKTTPGQSLHEYLADRKGFSTDRARQMGNQVTQTAKGAGLTFRLDQAVVANTHDAHRLIHLAAARGLQDQAEERLFAAYFTEGRDVSDHDTLLELGTDIGLDAGEVKQVLQSDAYAAEVQTDQDEAMQVGARGVPFFVFGEKYAVSGAQPSEVFAGALRQTWEEIQAESVPQAEGGFCTTDGECK
jgi:predicted DsbA family dithiol-disulfide isomerase